MRHVKHTSRPARHAVEDVRAVYNGNTSAQVEVAGAGAGKQQQQTKEETSPFNALCLEEVYNSNISPPLSCKVAYPAAPLVRARRGRLSPRPGA
eukprot:767671-Hanusia_phi.AAC.2